MELSIDTEQFVLGNSSTAFSKVFLEIFPRKIPQKSCRNLLGKFHWNGLDAVHGTLLAKKLKKVCEKFGQFGKKLYLCIIKKGRNKHTNKTITH